MASIKAQSNNTIILQKFILDPLSTIIKLAVLGKKIHGCKISIKNNQLYIQEFGFFQGISRYYMGDTKNDIHYLSIPIEIGCKRYLTNEKIKEIPNIIIIFKCAQQGLNNLMETYIDYPIIVHCLKYYNSIIDTHIHLIKCDQLPQINNKIENKPVVLPIYFNPTDNIHNKSYKQLNKHIIINQPELNQIESKETKESKESNKSNKSK